MLKIVLDTNVLLVSISPRSRYRWIFDALLDKRFTLCVCLLLFLVSCSTPEQPIQIRNTGKHQTSYTFNLPIERMQDSILSAFQYDNQINSKLLHSVFHYRFPKTDKEEDLHQVYFTSETKKGTLFSKTYFQSGHKNDIYLHAFGEAWDSPTYYANNKQLEFRCDFVLRVDSIDNKRTKVTIEAEHPRVINGTVGIGPHGSVAREVAVKSTTVEEYTLLKYLALEVGDTSRIN